MRLAHPGGLDLHLQLRERAGELYLRQGVYLRRGV
jgi:hypothetical protein